MAEEATFKAHIVTKRKAVQYMHHSNQETNSSGSKVKRLLRQSDMSWLTAAIHSECLIPAPLVRVEQIETDGAIKNGTEGRHRRGLIPRPPSRSV